MKKKYKIHVRDENKDIFRALSFENIGNFCPCFCQYKGQKRLVSSEEGDISDPFRADITYLKSLFI